MTEHLIAAYSLLLLKKNDSVLLLKRSNGAKFGPGQYCLPGGRVEKNESFRKAIIRESHEELGITIDSRDLKLVHTFYRHGTENELAAFIFECTKWQGEIVNQEPLKHPEFTWSPLDRLPSNLLIPHANALNAILKATAYSEQ